MLGIILALLLQVANPPEAKEGPDRVIHVTFPAGASDICVFVRRETKQEPDSNFPDGYYTPSSCAGPLGELTNYDTDMWDEIMPWFESHNEPKSEWTVWAEITYVIPTSDLAEPKTEIRKTEPYKVTR